jgi:hypothetical protein
MNVVQTASVKVKCTEFEPECDFVDTTLTVFAVTVLSIVHAEPNVVPFSKPSQNTAAAGQPTPPSPEGGTSDPFPLSDPPPSPLVPASSVDIVMPPLEPLDPTMATPPPVSPDELLPTPPLPLLLPPLPPLLPPLPLLLAAPGAVTSPPLLDAEPACVAAAPLDEPPCPTDPRSDPGDVVAVPQAPIANQAKTRPLVRTGPLVQEEAMVIRSPRVLAIQWRIARDWLSFLQRNAQSGI